MRRTNGTRPPFSVSWKPREGEGGGGREGRAGGRTFSEDDFDARLGTEIGPSTLPTRLETDPWRAPNAVPNKGSVETGHESLPRYPLNLVKLSTRDVRHFAWIPFFNIRLKQSNISYSSTYSFRGSRSTRDVRHFRWILNKRGMGEGTFLRLKSIEYLRYI